MEDRIIRETECKALTSLSKSTRRILEINGDFPKRKKLGPRCVGWLLSEIIAWMTEQKTKEKK